MEIQTSRLNQVAATVTLVIVNSSFRKKKVALFGASKYSEYGYKKDGISIICPQSAYTALLRALLDSQWRFQGVRVSVDRKDQLKRRWKIRPIAKSPNPIIRFFNWVIGKGDFYKPVQHQSAFVNIQTMVDDPYFHLNVTSATQIEFTMLPNSKMDVTFTLSHIYAGQKNPSEGFNSALL